MGQPRNWRLFTISTANGIFTISTANEHKEICKSLCIAVSVLYKNTTIGVGYRLLYIYISFIGENSYWWNTRIYTKLVSDLLLRVHHVPCMGLNTATGEQQFLLITASAHQEYTPVVLFCLLHVHMLSLLWRVSCGHATIDCKGILLCFLNKTLAIGYMYHLLNLTSEQLLCVCRISIQKASVVAGLPCHKLWR